MRSCTPSHAKRSIVCDSNEEKPEILRCGRLYLPDYRRIYGSTDTACYILKSTKGQYNASMSSVRIIFNHMPILEDLCHILVRFRAKYFVILILLLFYRVYPTPVVLHIFHSFCEYDQRIRYFQHVHNKIVSHKLIFVFFFRHNIINPESFLPYFRGPYQI